MKQKDIALVAIVAIITGMFSLFIANAVFGSPDNRSTKVPVVEPISAEFPRPSADHPEYQAFFNKDALNPTQTIKIGDSANTKPFNAP